MSNASAVGPSATQHTWAPVIDGQLTTIPFAFTPRGLDLVVTMEPFAGCSAMEYTFEELWATQSRIIATSSSSLSAQGAVILAHRAKPGLQVLADAGMHPTRKPLLTPLEVIPHHYGPANSLAEPGMPILGFALVDNRCGWALSIQGAPDVLGFAAWDALDDIRALTVRATDPDTCHATLALLDASQSSVVAESRRDVLSRHPVVRALAAQPLRDLDSVHLRLKHAASVIAGDHAVRCSRVYPQASVEPEMHLPVLGILAMDSSWGPFRWRQRIHRGHRTALRRDAATAWRDVLDYAVALGHAVLVAPEAADKQGISRRALLIDNRALFEEHGATLQQELETNLEAFPADGFTRGTWHMPAA